jgi:hypothetical protein
LFAVVEELGGLGQVFEGPEIRAESLGDGLQVVGGEQKAKG